ncbi:hypothetical protein ABK046_42480 [Streptomyces caeruleatus]
MSRVGAAIGTFLLPRGPKRFGAQFVLLIGAGVLAVGGLVSQFLAPETLRPRTWTWPRRPWCRGAERTVSVHSAEWTETVVSGRGPVNRRRLR